MFTFKANNTEYKIKFGYRVLCKTNLIDRVANISKRTDNEHPFQDMISTVAELLLAGLQKNHYDQFGYESEEEKSAAMEKVYNLLDSYEEEGTDENPQDGYIMFDKLQNELMSNGFLSHLQEQTATVLENQNATKIPQDHKQKVK